MCVLIVLFVCLGWVGCVVGLVDVVIFCRCIVVVLEV